MIRIEKPTDPPQVLIDHAEDWTSVLLKAVNDYGSYKDIPKEIKDKLLMNYRHQEIKDKLFECSHYKCAFCECIPGESSNIEVEHFAPKSIYYDKTFDWDNLLPVCRKCNESKSSFDTIKEPIINPSKVNPEDYLSYNLLNIIPSINCTDIELSKRTIDICNLNSTRLFKARSDLLYNLSIYESDLLDWMEEIEEADTERKITNKIVKLINSIDSIDKLKESNEKFAGFCRSFLENSEPYLRAKTLIQEFRVRSKRIE